MVKREQSDLERAIKTAERYKNTIDGLLEVVERRWLILGRGVGGVKVTHSKRAVKLLLLWEETEERREKRGHAK